MQYYFPSEDNIHEGTWLTWPHQYTFGIEYREEIEDIWIKMTKSLQGGENIHIIAYDAAEKKRISELLSCEKIDMSKIDFVVAKSDDVWSRDTGPIFVTDENGEIVIADFAFDGWGDKAPYKLDDKLPQAVASAKKIPIVEVPEFVLEGGSVDFDGDGTAILCESSVISKNRNPNMSKAQAETYLKKYFGVENFIWLLGVTDEDITDAHIDGTARFFNNKTLLTVSEDDFFELYDGMPEKDYETLLGAKNANGEPYEIVELPLTSKIVEGAGCKGSYLNYYVGNEVVLVPVYDDVNDSAAIEILSGLYDGREVIPINVCALIKYGGMLHCVTQQQPSKKSD